MNVVLALCVLFFSFFSLSLSSPDVQNSPFNPPLPSPLPSRTHKQIHPAGKWILKIESEAWEEIQWVQDKSWSFLFAESPVMSILRDDDDDEDNGKPRRARPARAPRTPGSGSDDSPRTPPLHGRSRQTKTRSRVFTSGGSRMQTDSPLQEEEDEVRARRTLVDTRPRKKKTLSPAAAAVLSLTQRYLRVCFSLSSHLLRRRVPVPFPPTGTLSGFWTACFDPCATTSAPPRRTWSRCSLPWPWWPPGLAGRSSEEPPRSTRRKCLDLVTRKGRKSLFVLTVHTHKVLCSKRKEFKTNITRLSPPA